MKGERTTDKTIKGEDDKNIKGQGENNTSETQSHNLCLLLGASDL